MKSILIASAILAGTATISAAGAAVGTYAKHHPRIHEINTRLRAQNAWINHAFAVGKISMTEATQLHAEDASIKQAEKEDESFDKGHITKADRRALNQQLDDVSRALGGHPHPRVREVNERLHALNERITHDKKTDKISAELATQFHEADAGIKSLEKADEATDDGHITRGEQESLNGAVTSLGHDVSNAAGTTGSHGDGSHGGHGGHR